MTATLRWTVCELPDPSTDGLEAVWSDLVEHVRRRSSDAVLLPEMPFHPWPADRAGAGDGAWAAAVAAHDRWEGRLHELGAELVAASRPVVDAGKRYNEGVLWTPEGTRGVHRKSCLPDEEGFWEASCYDAGPRRFDSVSVRGMSVGFLICTELWFPERVRPGDAGGVDLILCPRATPEQAADKWLAGGRVAAVVGGAFCLSSNRVGAGGAAGAWAGRGWIAHPEHGDLLAVTSPEQPFATVEIDPRDARRAKATYPRYVRC